MRPSLDPHQVERYYRQLIDNCKTPSELYNVIDELFLDCKTLDILVEREGLLEKKELPPNRTLSFYTALHPQAFLTIYGYAQTAINRLRKMNPKLPVFDFKHLQGVAIFTGFRIIQQWCAGEPAEAAAGQVQTKECPWVDNDKDNNAEHSNGVTLRDFMQQECGLDSRQLLDSRTKGLQKANKSKIIKLPNPIAPWRSGQSKKYLRQELKQNWFEYGKVVPNLPALQQNN